MIILFDHGLCARTRQTLNRHVENTRVQFDKQALKLNAYNLKTREGIEKACQGILRKNNSKTFLNSKSKMGLSPYTKTDAEAGLQKNGDEKVAVTTASFHCQADLSSRTLR